MNLEKKLKKLRWLPEAYWNALTEFIQGIEKFLDDIACIAIVGSASRKKDFISGWSELDVLVVVKKRELIDHIKSIANNINSKYPKTEKGVGIISLWIDDLEHVFKWLGIGCEYYNIMKNFVLIHGEDIRKYIAKPDKRIIKESCRGLVNEAKKYLEKMEYQIDKVLQKIDSLSIAGYIYPILRFYLCLKGFPVASRIDMIKILRKKRKNLIELNNEEIDSIIKVLEDILKKHRSIDPERNRTVYSAIKRILEWMERYTLSNNT